MIRTYLTMFSTEGYSAKIIYFEIIGYQYSSTTTSFLSSSSLGPLLYHIIFIWISWTSRSSQASLDLWNFII